MPDMLPISLDDMIAEVRRELDMRARVYPEYKREAGRVKRNRLDHQYEVMEAILHKLEGERDGTRD